MKLFLSFHLDDADGTLWRGHEQVPLTRKAAALLRCLVDRAGSSVEKADIMRAVWPDTHVHPDNVKVLVREIRLALGDDPHTPTFIRSDAGRGYTFIAPVAERTARATSSAAAGSWRRSSKSSTASARVRPASC